MTSTIAVAIPWTKVDFPRTRHQHAQRRLAWGGVEMSLARSCASRALSWRLVAIVVALVAVLAVGRPATAEAAVPMPPYLDTARNSQLYNNVTGNAWPDTFPAEWAKPQMSRVARVARFLPPLRTVGTIGLGVTAFELGWLIGRTIDERWLHISSSMTNGKNTSGNGGCNGWTIAAKQFTWSPPAAPGYWLLTFESWRPDGTPNGNSTVWPPTTNPCSSSYQAAAQNLPGGPATVNDSSVWVATEAQMDAALSAVDVPYVNQPYGMATTWTVPTMTEAVLQAIRDAIAAEGTAFINEVNAALDPTTWQRPLPTSTPSGSIPADNGGPLLVEWLGPDPQETYADYLARLRQAGWVGNALVESLTPDEADHTVRLGGVPCTSQEVGSVVPRGASATFYVNPTVPLSSASGSDGGSCGGGFVTPAAGKCKFNDTITVDQQRGWERTIEDYGPYVLEQECGDAWQILQDLGLLDAQGALTQTGIDAARELSTVIANPAVREVLPNYGLNVEAWHKASIESFLGVPLRTQAGHEFQLHFYRDSAGNTYTGQDFHVVFQDWFG